VNLAAKEQTMKTTIPKLRQIVRRVITESINDEERVADMIMFLDDLMENSEEYDYDGYGVESKLRDAFPDATEDEIRDAMERF
jgi:hypothetical protein